MAGWTEQQLSPVTVALVVFAGMLPGGRPWRASIAVNGAVANKFVSPDKLGVDDERRAARAK